MAKDYLVMMQGGLSVTCKDVASIDVESVTDNSAEPGTMYVFLKDQEDEVVLFVPFQEIGFVAAVGATQVTDALKEATT